MSLNLGGSGILKISQIGGKIEIQAEAEKKAFDISSIVDVELELIKSEDPFRCICYRWNCSWNICR